MERREVALAERKADKALRDEEAAEEKVRAGILADPKMAQSGKSSNMGVSTKSGGGLGKGRVTKF